MKLTEREIEVLRCFAAGKANPETAISLGIGSETVRSHLKRICKKLGANNKTHAVALAFQLKIFCDIHPKRG